MPRWNSASARAGTAIGARPETQASRPRLIGRARTTSRAAKSLGHRGVAEQRVRKAGRPPDQTIPQAHRPGDGNPGDDRLRRMFGRLRTLPGRTLAVAAGRAARSLRKPSSLRRPADPSRVQRKPPKSISSPCALRAARLSPGSSWICVAKTGRSSSRICLSRVSAAGFRQHRRSNFTRAAKPLT